MILLLADIHIKLGQDNVPLDWALNRYDMFFKKIQNIIKYQEITEVVIAGDTFDRLPKLEELALFVDFIKIFTVPTYITTGNHEATKKGSTFLSRLEGLITSINPNITVVLAPTTVRNDFHIVPYEYIKDNKVWDSLSELPVFTHVRGEIPPHVKPEIDLEVLNKFPIVYAGDLHSFSNSQRNIVYPGEPMTTSFHRSKTNKGYIIIDSNDLTKYTWHDFELPQLIRKTVASEEDMTPTEVDHTIYELTGTLESLATITKTDLLDKKIVKRKSDVALILHNMTIQEELKEYLAYILDLPDVRIQNLLGVFHGYNKAKGT